MIAREFKGSTKECFTHLVKGMGDNLLSSRKLIASFTGVLDSTVARWIKDSVAPKGESLLRLRFYLEFLGYNVEELLELNPLIRNAARLCAFQVETLTTVAHLVGYPEGRNGIDGLIAVFRGTRSMSEKRLQHLASFVELYSDQLKGKQQATQKVEVMPHKQITPEVPKRPLISRMSRQPLEAREAIIASIAYSVLALIPLAVIISSDTYTAADRKQVRERAGGDGVFKLANLLYRLCGERTRTIHSK